MSVFQIDTSMGDATYHRICECRRDGDCHPPYQSLQELAAFSSHQAADKPSVELSYVQTYHRPQHKEDAVTDDQPELFASPSWYTDLEQSEEIFEELAIQLDLLSPCSFAFTWPCSRLPLCFTTYRSCFLLGDSIAYAVYEGDEKGEVNGA